MKGKIITLLSILFLSCYQSLYDTDVAVVHLDEKVKKTATLLNVDIINTDTILETAKNCFVYSDSILVVQNIKGSDKAFIEFYNLKNNNKIKETILRGNGPNELLNVIAWNSGDFLLIDGFVNHKFAKINVNSFINNPSNKITFHPYSFHAQSMELFNDSIFLVENPYCFYNKKLGIKQKVSRLYLSNGNYEYYKKNQISAINVNIGDIIIKPDHTKIVYSSRRKPFIEVYDIDLTLKKVINGPDYFDLDYKIDGDMIQYLNNTPHSYMASCYNDTIIYLAYEGVVKKHNSVIETQTDNNNNTWIFKLDWDGNILNSYYIQNIKILSLSLGLNNTLYYGCKLNGEIKLAKSVIK